MLAWGYMYVTLLYMFYKTTGFNIEHQKPEIKTKMSENSQSLLVTYRNGIGKR